MTEQGFLNAAKILGVPVATIKAVTEVEGRGKGFLRTGEPIILFEPHIFWKELKKRGIDPNEVLKEHPDTADILYPIWKPGLYGPSTSQHGRLQRAVAINRHAALASASWGAFQILGQNYGLAGYDSIQDFITAMYANEDNHLKAFVTYVKKTGLDDELRAQDWAGFARGYNGPSYWKNQYDKKLAAAYKKYV